MSEISPEDALKICGIEYAQVGTEWLHVRCPFHLDDHADLTGCKGRINPDNGAYKCNAAACGTTASHIGFIAAALKKNIHEVKKLISVTTGKAATLSEGLVLQMHRNLCQSAEMQAKLRKKGIEIADITKYQLGYNANNQRVTIPVYTDGKLVNIRSYLFGAAKGKKYLNEKGHGELRIYPDIIIPEQGDVYVTEGEFKAIVLRKYGFEAVSPTGGADNWNAEFNDRFRDRHVVIVLDADDAGRRGAGYLASILHRYARSVRNVFLSETLALGPGKNDVVNYFVDLKKSADDFRQLVIATDVYEPPTAPVNDLLDETIHDVSLAESSAARLHRKRIRAKVVVSAKDSTPYVVPKDCSIQCEADQPYCNLCHVSTNRGYKFTVQADDPKILELVGKPTKIQHSALKSIAGIYPKCGVSKLHIETSYNLEELRLIPQIEVGHSTSEMVVRRVFAVGHGIETNTTYEIVARMCVDPDTQHATLVVYEYAKAQDDISSFVLKHDLTLFQPSEWTTSAVEAKLADIYEDLSHNVTKIYDRPDLHFFVDLVFHSILYVPFQGDNRKGWVDALCIGDSGQGKTECSSRLIKHYSAGERVDTKSSSVAGILGGLQETAGRWFTTWGTVPLNDRRLVVLEEIKGMPVEALAKLTDMRSSGVAEIVKIERSKTNARTRLLWISNPRSDRKLCTYNYGVDAVRELIGSLEDIRRFDMCIALASGAVSADIINCTSADRQVIDHAYTAELSHHLVMWSWSRKETNVRLLPEAERVLLEAATRMGRTYSSSCPIVEPSDQRLKLLRLSAACAARTFSTEDGETLCIRACHVEAVERFLNRIYSDKALGYAEYSAAQMSESVITNPEEIEAAITKKLPNSCDSVRSMIDTDAITVQTIMDITEWMKEDAAWFIGLLVRKQALRPLRRGGYRKTPAFTELLKKLDRQGLENKTLQVLALEEPEL